MTYGRLLVKLGRLLVAFLGKSWSSFGSLFKNIKSGKELLSLTVAPLSDIVEVWFGHLKTELHGYHRYIHVKKKCQVA